MTGEERHLLWGQSVVSALSFASRGVSSLVVSCPGCVLGGGFKNAAHACDWTVPGGTV